MFARSNVYRSGKFCVITPAGNSFAVADDGMGEDAPSLGFGMTAPAVKEESESVPIGVTALSVLADPLNFAILQRLKGGALTAAKLLADLPASRATRFKRLRDLEGLGLIAREKRSGWPPPTYCRLSAAGGGLLSVAKRFEAWLGQGREGGCRDEIERVMALKALASGIASTLLRWLGEGPRSATELEALTPSEVSHHDVQRTLRALSEAGLAEPSPRRVGRRLPYALTAMGHKAAVPLIAMLQWEGEHLLEGALDADQEALVAETLIYLAAPLVSTPPRANGFCSIGVARHRTIRMAILEGRIEARLFDPGEETQAQVLGSGRDWLDALAKRRPELLETRGDTDLIGALMLALQRVVC